MGKRPPIGERGASFGDRPLIWETQINWEKKQIIREIYR